MMKLTNSLAITISFGALLFHKLPPDVIVALSGLAASAAISIFLTPAYHPIVIGRVVRFRQTGRI